MGYVFLSKTDTEPYEPITELEYPTTVIVNDYSNEDYFEKVGYCFLVVKDVEDETTLKHLRLKVEAEEQNLGVSFWICLSDENDDDKPSNNWTKTLDLYNVPNNSVIKIWYKWQVLNNLLLTTTGKYPVNLNIYTVQEES